MDVLAKGALPSEIEARKATFRNIFPYQTNKSCQEHGEFVKLEHIEGLLFFRNLSKQGWDFFGISTFWK